MSDQPRHFSTVAIDGRAVLIEGPSGAGKSDLALRLIDRGAMLVSDDYTALSVENGVLIASAPATIAGRIEVRGLGIIAVDHLPQAPAALLVVLTEDVERMPDDRTRDLMGVTLPMLTLNGREPSASIKVELALKRLIGE